jgi:hypothetical protein
VRCNLSDQTTPGAGVGPEDHISTFSSSGTADSPFDIAYNKIRGGGPSTSGGGILAGDFGGDYITVRDNILVNPGQYGLAIAGGTHHRFLRNIVYAPDVFPWSNNGFFAWAQQGFACDSNEMANNRVFYMNSDGVQNSGWDAGNCGDIAGWGTNVFGDTTLTMAVWDTEFEACRE